MQLKKTSTGFTIVELLIVIVVIGILAAITIVSFNGVQQRARVASLQSDLVGSAKIIEAYKFSTSTSEQYPIDTTVASLKASSGTSYDYSVDNTVAPANYCLTATNGSVSYYVGATNNRPQVGSCFANYGLVGWWPLNGNANDGTSNGNNATVTGATLTTGQNGAANSAYSFVAAADVINIPASPILNNQIFTYTAWVKPAITAAGMTVIGGSVYGGIQLRVDTGKPTLLSQASYQFPASSGTVTVNTWSQIAVSYSANGTYTYYVNGVAAGSAINLRTFTFGAAQIGSVSGQGERFTGAVDSVRMYNRVLSATEMLALYNSAQ